MNYGIIVAAGSGSRMGKPQGKVFLPLGGKPLLAWSLKAFDRSPLVDELLLVVRREDWDKALEAARTLGKRIKLVEGGETRQISVRNALQEVPWDSGVVLIHDAARPFVSQALIARCCQSAEEYGSGVAALAVKDTIKRARDGIVVETLPREELWAMQTPQAFRAALIHRAHAQSVRDATDDAALLEHIGHQVRLVSGEESCFKVTTPWDMAIAQSIARDRSAGT